MYVQHQTAPGALFEFAPLAYPAASAVAPVGSVAARNGERLAKASWIQMQELYPDPSSSMIWPLTGPLSGLLLRHAPPAVPDQQPYVFWTQNWAYFRSDGRAHTSSLLAAGNRLALTPCPVIEELVGQASLWPVGTSLAFGGRSVLVDVNPEGASVWKAGELSGPGLVMDDLHGPLRLTSPLGPHPTVMWGYQGTLQLPTQGVSATRQFLLLPGQRTMLFRPDGAAASPLFLSSGRLNLTSGVPPALIMATSLSATQVAGADKIHFRSASSAEEQTWFFKSGTVQGVAGWYRLHSSAAPELIPESEAAAVRLAPGEVVYLSRAAGKPQAVWKLPLPENLFSAPAALSVPATSLDGDRLPDFWESFHFSNITLSSVREATDQDGDGIGNLAEFYLGGNPASPGHPALLDIEPITRHEGGAVASYRMSFHSGAGMRYRIETRLAGSAVWGPAAAGIIGTGGRVSYAWAVPAAELASRDARLFRVAALGPADTDMDGLYDMEETYLGTDPANPDTDGDGMTDGAEIRTRGKRNPLDYWDHAVFTFKVTGDRQAGAPGGWCRDPIKITVTRTLPGSTALVPLPANLSVNFIMTRGSALFAADPDHEPVPVLLGRRLVMSPDLKRGEAVCYVRFGAPGQNRLNANEGCSPVQGIVSVRVDSDPLNLKLYNESFLMYPSDHLNLAQPEGSVPTGLVTWLRADRQAQVVNGRVVRWGGDGAGAGAMPGYPGPAISVDASGRKWLEFTGSEALLLDELIPQDAPCSLFLNAQTSVSRTAAASNSPENDGARGQFYLLSGALPPGISGLPNPWDAAAYRSLGISMGAVSAGLFEIGVQPLVSSPSLIPSQSWTAALTDGLLLGLIIPAPTSSVPSLRVTGRAGVSAAWPQAPSAPLFMPRMIGGRAGGSLSSTTGSGMFVGRIRDLLVFNRALAPAEAQAVEDAINSEKAVFVPGSAAGYKALAPAINRDPGSPAVDSLPDWWERTFWGSLTLSKNADDPDNDNISNLTEIIRGLHPRMSDTDGDGLSDSVEHARGTSPVSWDTDNDLIPDNLDRLPLDPRNGFNNTDGTGIADGWDWLLLNQGAGTDSDGDGLSDLFEVAWLGTDANVANIIDADGDGIPDHWEAFYFSDLDPPHNDPNETSSYEDGDGISDLNEFLLGLNPRRNDFLQGDHAAGLSNEDVLMDDQGRVRQVGDRVWSYDAEGNVIGKSNGQGL